MSGSSSLPDRRQIRHPFWPIAQDLKLLSVLEMVSCQSRPCPHVELKADHGSSPEYAEASVAALSCSFYGMKPLVGSTCKEHERRAW